MAASTPFRIVHTVCSHDCPDSCAVLVTVNEEGRAVKVEGDPSQPVTQGFLCGKVAKYLDRVYAPDRILYPLRRKAGVAKGPLQRGQRARSLRARELGRSAGRDCRAAQADQRSATGRSRFCLTATRAPSACSAMDRWIAASFIAWARASLTAPSVPRPAARRGTWSTARNSARRRRISGWRSSILAWGANIHGNNIHLWPFVEQARRNGARLIVIDPYRTRTAAVADWHIAIRPGTDAALALGMMHVILNEGLEDRAYIAEMTHGFERLAERVREYTPERVAAWTGMTAAEVEQLAREYATTRPAALRLNYGVQRCENGGTAVRAIAMLPALTGAWKTSRRRRTTFDFGRVSVGQEGARAARSGARPRRLAGLARSGEHVGAWPRAHRAGD